LTEQDAFADYLEPLRKIEWVVYAKRPFAWPDAVLAYLSRYTHRVAISNSRLISCDEHGVTFKWKDYRAKGPSRRKTMTLATDEFIRRFLLHVLPHGFHRIRHYGLFANSRRAANLALARQLINMPPANAEDTQVSNDESRDETSLAYLCPACGGAMVIIERFEPGAQPYAPRAPPPSKAVAA
jgi:hypothetical protein